jgi:hypothetical protein
MTVYVIAVESQMFHDVKWSERPTRSIDQTLDSLSNGQSILHILLDGFRLFGLMEVYCKVSQQPLQPIDFKIPFILLSERLRKLLPRLVQCCLEMVCVHCFSSLFRNSKALGLLSSLSTSFSRFGRSSFNTLS